MPPNFQTYWIYHHYYLNNTTKLILPCLCILLLHIQSVALTTQITVLEKHIVHLISCKSFLVYISWGLEDGTSR